MPVFQLGNWAPRLGFAWDVFDDGKTSIRGGWGVYGELILTPFLNLPGLRTPPFFNRGTFSGDEAEILLMGTFPNGGFIAFANSPQGLQQNLDPIEVNPPQPNRMQFNLNVQQQLARNTVVTVAYVGASGSNFGHVQRDVNLAEDRVVNDRLFFDSGQSRRNPNFLRMGARQFNSNNNYHSLQLGLNRRFTEGLRLQGSYTWSKAIDEGSTVFSSNQYDSSIPNPYFEIPEYNRAPSDFDIRNAFNLNFTYDLPTLGDGTAAMILGGWKIGGILTLVSGAPVTPRQDDDRMQTLTGSDGNQVGDRPDLVSGADSGADPPDGADRTMIFDVSAFMPSLIACGVNPGDVTATTNGVCTGGLVQTGGFGGQVGRNTVFGDNLTTFDMNLTKDTQVSENVTLQFRAEFFNLFNNVNMDLPHSNIVIFSGGGDSTVGGGVDPTAGGGFATRTLSRSREIQLGFKLIF